MMFKHFDDNEGEEEFGESEEQIISGIFAALQSVTAAGIDEVYSMEDNMDTLLANMDTSTAAITWEAIKREVHTDETSIMLRDWIVRGCQDDLKTSLRTSQDPSTTWAFLSTHIAVRGAQQLITFNGMALNRVT